MTGGVGGEPSSSTVGRPVPLSGRAAGTVAHRAALRRQKLSLDFEVRKKKKKINEEEGEKEN